VNNAGIDYLDKLNDLPLKDIVRLIDLDCFFVNSVQYLFLDRWVRGGCIREKDDVGEMKNNNR